MVPVVTMCLLRVVSFLFVLECRGDIWQKNFEYANKEQLVSPPEDLKNYKRLPPFPESEELNNHQSIEQVTLAPDENDHLHDLESTLNNLNKWDEFKKERLFLRQKYANSAKDEYHKQLLKNDLNEWAKGLKEDAHRSILRQREEKILKMPQMPSAGFSPYWNPSVMEKNEAIMKNIERQATKPPRPKFDLQKQRMIPGTQMMEMAIRQMEIAAMVKHAKDSENGTKNTQRPRQSRKFGSPIHTSGRKQWSPITAEQPLDHPGRQLVQLGKHPGMGAHWSGDSLNPSFGGIPSPEQLKGGIFEGPDPRQINEPPTGNAEEAQNSEYQLMNGQPPMPPNLHGSLRQPGQHILPRPAGPYGPPGMPMSPGQGSPEFQGPPWAYGPAGSPMSSGQGSPDLQGPPGSYGPPGSPISSRQYALKSQGSAGSYSGSLLPRQFTPGLNGPQSQFGGPGFPPLQYASEYGPESQGQSSQFGQPGLPISSGQGASQFQGPPGSYGPPGSPVSPGQYAPDPRLLQSQGPPPFDPNRFRESGLDPGNKFLAGLPPPPQSPYGPPGSPLGPPRYEYEDTQDVPTGVKPGGSYNFRGSNEPSGPPGPPGGQPDGSYEPTHYDHANKLRYIGSAGPPPPTWNWDTSGLNQTNNKDFMAGMEKLKRPDPFSELPQADDFGVPIRWVTMKLVNTEDGLARVTDRKTGRNMQTKINGTLYVPVNDHVTITPTTPTTTTVPTTTPDPVMEAMLQFVTPRNLVPQDWLAFDATLNKMSATETCAEDGCPARCHKDKCLTACRGDTCSTGCIGISCNAMCEGPGCLSMCIGNECSAQCKGNGCEARCIGKNCDAYCNSNSCAYSRNGDVRSGSPPAVNWQQKPKKPIARTDAEDDELGLESAERVPYGYGQFG